MWAKSSRQYYTAMQKSGQTDSIDLKNIDLKNIDLKTIDPYGVLNLSKKFTWNELKESYRKLAMNTHPDKPGGNNELFKIITYSFEKLTDDFKNREKDLSHTELKKNSEQYFNKITNNISQHPSDILTNNDSTNEVFSSKFNNKFEKCKMYDDYTDFGYGEKMDESTKIREDINIEKLIKKKKIDNESFNELFNKNVPVYKQLVKYIEPEPMLLAKSLNFTELGGQKPDDYSSSIDKNNSLAYTDYMRAHNGSRLVDQSLIDNIKQFKTVDEYELYSNNKINKVMTNKELKSQEKNKLKLEKEELYRLERVEKYDKRIEKTFEKANKLFLR